MLILYGANEIATCCKTPGARREDDGIIKNGSIAIDGEKIIAVGPTARIAKRFRTSHARFLDVSGKIILPGFIDCHTHLVFGGSRADEYEHTLRGESYESVHKKGGGIHRTVKETRRSSEALLFNAARARMREMLRRGTTTVEIKSGYGLSLRDELKILRVIRRLSRSEPQDVIATFLGAHSVPREYKSKRDVYVRSIIAQMLPAVQKSNLAEYCDVFCDPLGFSTAETRAILARARALGFKLRIHAEQTRHFGGARLAAEFRASSADHCDFSTDSDIFWLKKSGVVATLLPGVLFHLMMRNSVRTRFIAKKLRTSSVPVACATDYNPGSSPVLSLKLIMDMALRFLRMGYDECLRAVTIHAARSLDRADRIGSIEAGKQADLLVTRADTVKDYCHDIGDREFSHIVKRGRIIIP